MPATVTVKLLALSETTPSILYAIYDVLNSFEPLWATLTHAPAVSTSFETRIASPTGEMFISRGGIPIAPHESLMTNSVPDIIIVPDIYVMPDEDPRDRWPEAAAWLRRMHAAGTTVCSVCTGSLLLASAGLLDNRTATTHWGYTETFRRHFPQVDLQPERILVRGDADGTVITTGGPSTWHELALYLIARYRGEAAAAQASKIFLMGDKTDGQLIYTALLRPEHHDDAVIADAQAWLADNYRIAGVAAMVARSGIAERTFKRRFKHATGYTPIDYIQTLRTEEAKQLLETTDTPIDDIGEAVGYEDPTFFRRLFKRATGVTPSRYRAKMRITSHH